MHRRTGLFLMGALVSGMALADTHTWVGGHSSGGGWNVATNWQNELGENEVPAAGDTAKFNVFVTNVVTDTDLPVFNSLSRVWLNHWNWTLSYGVTLVLDTTTDPLDVQPSINGAGNFVKRGANRVNLVSANETGASEAYGVYGVYMLSGGGMFVEGGSLSLIQTTAREYIYPALTVAEGATVYLPTNGNVTISALFGGGTVINADTREKPSVRNLNINYYGNYVSPDGGHFDGKVSGPLTVYVKGRQTFSGVENDFTGSFYSTYGSGGGYLQKHAWAFLKKFGNKNEPSSAGQNGDIYLFYGGSLGYLGDGTPETSDRGICSEARNSSGLSPQCLDAGTNGNLTITGSFYLSNYGNEYNMRSFVFRGSNAAPCTVAGPFNLRMSKDSSSYDYNFYVRKEGPGVWQFKENAKSTFKGVFDVREGTLRFDTLAPKGQLSALGFSSQLTDEFRGPYDASHDSPYAFRVGTTNLADAAQAVFEFNGAKAGSSTDRPLLLTGDATIRANGTTDDATLVFGDVRAADEGTTLTLDGTNTAANTLRELMDGDGSLALVKDGPGTWCLAGNQDFSGDLSVKEGTLVVEGPQAYTWFRFVITDGYGNPHGGYLAEIGLYDANGVRRNLDLTFPMPTGKKWGETYYPTDVDTQGLAAGTLSFALPGNNYYLYESRPITALCDGAGTITQFSSTFSAASTNTVVMHLTNGSEVVAVDFVQENGHYGYPDGYYQTASAFVLQGSLDGRNWKTLVEQKNLPHRDSKYWYYSTTDQLVASTGRADRKLADGQGLAFDHPAHDETSYAVLTNIGVVAVAPGAVLKTDGQVAPTIKRLGIDGQAGAGTIAGFRFAPTMTVDVKGLGTLTSSTRHLPLDFTGVENFADVTTWNFLIDGEASSKYLFRLTPTGLDISKRGMVILIR